MDGTRVLVVGEDALARGGLRAIASAAGLKVVAELEPAAAEAAGDPADLAVVELGPEAEAVEAVRALARQGPVLAVLWSASQAREALAAGAAGLLRRDGLAERLGAAAGAVANGLVVIDPELSESVFRPAPASTLVEPLTAREGEVLSLLVEGLGNRAIAARLGISEHTAKFHVNAILGKLGAQTRAEAVALAARLGLVVL